MRGRPAGQLTAARRKALMYWQRKHDAGEPIILGEMTVASSTGRVWPQLFDGRGLATDLALRFGVERLPELLLIDRQGKLAVTSAWIDDADGRTELRDAIERALGKS